MEFEILASYPAFSRSTSLMKDYSFILKLEELGDEIQKRPNSPLKTFLSKEQFIEFYHGYKLTLGVIADGLGVQVNRVHRLRKMYGIESTRKYKTITHCSEPYVFRGNYGPLRKQLTIEELKRKYVTEQKSMGDIAKEYGVSRTAVCKYLKDAGIISRSQHDARILAMKRGKVKQPYCAINEQFFSTWSKEMAWVLGLYLTDGCISEEPFGNNRMSFNSIDKDLVEKIRLHMKSTHDVFVDKRGPRTQYILSYISQKISDDLMNHGLSSRKSLTVRMPEVPQEFFPDFARGVFEGDGSHVIDKQNGRLRLSLVSGSKEFVHAFAKGLAAMGLTERKPYEYKRKGRKYFELKYGKATDCRLYYELAYKNTPHSRSMNRKRRIIEEWYNRHWWR